jgi:hypothetical protein
VYNRSVAAWPMLLKLDRAERSRRADTQGNIFEHWRSQ